jgi:trehalose 6-phosphate synthase
MTTAPEGARATSRPVVAVANRLPVQHDESGWQLSPGGLVTALRPVMTEREGVWIGWDGGTKGTPAHLPSPQAELDPVSLTPAQLAGYYHGFSNATLWPLLHNAIETPRFDRDWWHTYQRVNTTFAEHAARALADRPEALAWVHDYQLMLVPSLLRQLAAGRRIGFFLHVPWPSPDIFARLPWRREVLYGLLGADVVSFHTDAYRANFLRAIRRLLSDDAIEVRGSQVALPDGRVVAATAAPISIDIGQFREHARATDTEQSVANLAAQFAGRRLLLGVDRLDYTKGIVERLLAFEALLERRPDLRNRVTMLQIAVPSRDEIASYQQLRNSVESLVGRINGRFTVPGQDVPVHYLYRSMDQQQLSAYYAAADTLLVTPLIDGMNLVAKEYVTVQHARRGTGALVLSEFTGAADELREAVLCNPFDIDGLATRIEHALELSPTNRRTALTAMGRRVHRHDVHRWVATQLEAISGGA